MPTKNIAHKDLSNCSATWNSVDLGYIKSGDASGLQLKTKELVVGHFGDIPIGAIIIGMQGTLKLTLEQVKKESKQQLSPWWASGVVPMTPALRHKDLYDYAQVLVIHPIGVSGTDEDISLLKAYPMWKPPKFDGKEFQEIEVEFMFWPDRALLATNNYPTYGYFGAPPA